MNFQKYSFSVALTLTIISILFLLGGTLLGIILKNIKIFYDAASLSLLPSSFGLGYQLAEFKSHKSPKKVTPQRIFLITKKDLKD